MDSRNISFSPSGRLKFYQLFFSSISSRLKTYGSLKSRLTPHGGERSEQHGGKKMGKTNTYWEAINVFKERAEKINCKEHFRLKRYDITVKEVAKVRYGNHCKYNINYHFVWIPKTRMKMLVEPFKTNLESDIYLISQKNGWYPLALEIIPDHIHYFVSAHPKWAPTRMIQKIKQETSEHLRRKYAIIRETRETDDFWATGYYCGTAGHVSAVPQ